MDNRNNPFYFWQEVGLSVRAANLLTRIGCQSIDDLHRLGAAMIKTEAGAGPMTYNEIARVAGWDLLPEPVPKHLRPKRQTADERRVETLLASKRN